MSRIVLALIGSRGDVAPLIGLGMRLQQAGHDVLVAAYAEFDDLVSGCGLKFKAIDPTRMDTDDVNPIAALRTFLAPSGQRAIGDNMIAALRDEPADLLLMSPLAELGGHPLAEAKGIPGIGVRLQPLSATAQYPPAVLGPWTAGPRLNRMASDGGARAMDRLYGKTLAGFRRDLGLPVVAARALRRRRTEAEWPILYGYSPTVLPRPADWRPGLEVNGYWWPPRPIGWQPPDDVVAFLADGPPPVFVGFGSLLTGRAQAERTSEVVLDALRSTGARGIVQAGWAGLSASGADVLTIGDIPHDWLFERVAAVVHHCGAGTAAGGLRAGVPSVGVPVAGDQPFWARRLLELGVSAATIPHRRLTSDRLGAALRAALSDGVIRSNAKAVAARLADEDGADVALRVIERCLARS